MNKAQLRQFLDHQIVAVDTTRLDTHPKVARIAAKAGCRLGLGGVYLERAEKVITPSETVVLLGDLLKALNALGDEAGPFTVQECAERWHVSARTVANLVRAGRLGSFRLGSLIRITAEHIRAYEATPQRGEHRHL
jgi:excisionase family DNA binding protein